jgi:hypothetical protein
LLDKYRDGFCLSDEKGKEAVEFFEKIEVANQVREEEKNKYGGPVYQRVMQIKKIGIVELEKILSETLEKEKYIKLTLDRPEIGQQVIVPFTVQDADTARKDRNSTRYLEKVLKSSLEDTNWRLLSNSLMYRLGYVSGQLKGYENEEDMLTLAGKKKEKKPSKEDSEKRMKYAGDPLVQVAKIIGEHEGIENLRKKRLEKEPEGFLLGENEGPYSCCICGNQTPGNECWWDLNGIKCLDCQRNIKEGVIPAELCANEDLWLKDWQIRYDFGLNAATIRKLRREGLLKGIELKRKDETVYFTLYLNKDNQEFFKKYSNNLTIQIKES